MFDANDPHLDLVWRILILGPLALVWITAVVRIVGLRSFSKMAAFDFVVTVAIGSLLANAAVADTWPKFLQPAGAIALLLCAQAVIAILRRKSGWFGKMLENDPVLLMRDGKLDHKALRKTRVAVSDVRAKLREANALDLSKVRAVVLETTGDISVLHGDKVDDWLFEGVETGERSQEPSAS